MNGACSGRVLKTIGLFFLAALSLACVDRIGCLPGVADPGFEGTWAFEGVRLLVGRQPVSNGGCADIVFMFGSNEQTGSPWDRLSLSGLVVGVAEIRGDAILFSGDSVITSLEDVTVQRTPTVIVFRLRYTAPDGIARDEVFTLQKQTS